MNRSCRQKINKKTRALMGTLDQIKLTGIQRAFQLKTAEYTFSLLKKNLMDREAWKATAHGAAKNWTFLSQQHTQESSDSRSIIFMSHKESSGWGGSLEVVEFEFHPAAGFWLLLLASQNAQLGQGRRKYLLLFYFCIQ